MTRGFCFSRLTGARRSLRRKPLSINQAGARQDWRSWAEFRRSLIVYRRIEAPNLCVQFLRSLDEAAQRRRQKLNVAGIVRIGRCKLDLGLFLARLRERHLTFFDRAVKQEP